MVMLLSVIALCLGSISCERLMSGEPAIKGAPQLKIEPLKSLDAIPAEFGNLVGVTSDGRPGWAELWFEKPDRTIVVVAINFYGGGLWSHYVLVPRR